MNLKTMSIAICVSLVAPIYIARSSESDLVVTVVRDPRTSDIVVLLSNVGTMTQAYYDSLSLRRSIPPFMWCQLAVRDSKGDIVSESSRESLNSKDATAIELPVTLSSLGPGREVSKIVPRDRLRDIVEDMIVSQKDDRPFNAIRFVVAVARDASLSQRVLGETEYLDLADYRSGVK